MLHATGAQHNGLEKKLSLSLDDNDKGLRGVAGTAAFNTKESGCSKLQCLRRRGWWIKASVSQTSHAQKKMRSEQHRRRAEGDEGDDQRRRKQSRAGG